MFDQWFRSKKLDKTFSNLRQVILLEEFKDCVPQDLKTHLEDNVKALEEAAVISDTFTLSHKKIFFTRSQNNYSKSSDSYNKSVVESQSSTSSHKVVLDPVQDVLKVLLE